MLLQEMMDDLVVLLYELWMYEGSIQVRVGKELSVVVNT